MTQGVDADEVLSAFVRSRDLFDQARGSLARIDELRGTTEATGRRIDGAAERLDALASALTEAVVSVQRAGDATATLTADVSSLARASQEATVSARLRRLAEAVDGLADEMGQLRQEQERQRRLVVQQGHDFTAQVATLRDERRRDREVLDQVLSLVQRLGDKVEDTARHGAARDETFQDEVRAVQDVLSWRQRRRLERRGPAPQ